MSKSIRFGNVVEQKHGIIVHGCNAYGVMGSGVAAAVKAKWPAAFEKYHGLCKAAISDPSQLIGQIVWVQADRELYVANAITQVTFGRDPKVRYVRYDAIQKVFASVAQYASERSLPVHYPMIGAGLGNGDWSIIQELINNEFAPYPTVEHTLWLIEP